MSEIVLYLLYSTSVTSFYIDIVLTLSIKIRQSWDHLISIKGIPILVRQDLYIALQWSHNEHDGISNHHNLNHLLNHFFRCKSKKTSKICVTGLCEGNQLVTGGFPSQRASTAENISIWWNHHGDGPPVFFRVFCRSFISADSCHR